MKKDEPCHALGCKFGDEVFKQYSDRDYFSPEERGIIWIFVKLSKFCPFCGAPNEPINKEKI